MTKISHENHPKTLAARAQMDRDPQINPTNPIETSFGDPLPSYRLAQAVSALVLNVSSDQEASPTED